MTDFLQRLKAHKLVQGAVTYVAAAWVVSQVLDLVFGSTTPRFHVDGGAMAHVPRQRQQTESHVHQERFDCPDFALVAGTLQ